jgi:hypothetical protein
VELRNRPRGTRSALSPAPADIEHKRPEVLTWPSKLEPMGALLSGFGVGDEQ